MAEVTKTGSLGTNVTEIKDTIGVFYNALKMIEASQQSDGVKAFMDDESVADSLTLQQAEMLFDKGNLSDEQSAIVKSVLKKYGRL